MKIEHFALNVPDPKAMAAWYVQHCGLRVAFKLDEPPHTHFLADTGNHVLVEIYRNEKDPLPDYARQHPLRMHLAFTVGDPVAEQRRLEAAGAKYFEEVKLPDGSHLITLRDPWGIPIQVCRRGRPML